MSKTTLSLNETPALPARAINSTSSISSNNSSLAMPSSTASAVATTPGLRIYLTLAVGIVCLAFSAIFTRQSNVPGTVSAFYRVAIAAVVLALPFGRNLARHTVTLDRRVWLVAAAAGFFFMLDLALWNTSLFHISAANATLLANDAPIFVGLGSLLIFRAKLRLPYWAGLTLGIIGIAIIVGNDIFSTAHLGIGDVLAMTAGISYAGYLLTIQVIREKMDTLASLWIPGIVGALLLLAYNLATHQALWGFTLHTYLELLALGLISQVIGWLAINYALGHLPASVVSVTLLAQPVLTAFLAMPLLGQSLGPAQLLGGLVVLSGIYLVNRGVARK